MSRETDLSSALDNIAARLKEITANPKPNYTIDGQTVAWSDYLQSLLAAHTGLKEALVEVQGPFEVRSIGRT